MVSQLLGEAGEVGGEQRRCDLDHVVGHRVGGELVAGDRRPTPTPICGVGSGTVAPAPWRESALFLPRDDHRDRVAAC